GGLKVGSSSSDAKITIGPYARLETKSITGIALQPDSVGAVEVAGPRATWEAQSLIRVGGLGQGSLSISGAGAQLRLRDGADLFIGSVGGGIGLVQVSNGGKLLQDPVPPESQDPGGLPVTRVITVERGSLIVESGGVLQGERLVVAAEGTHVAIA